MSVANWSHVIEASFDKAPFPMTIKRCVTSHNYLTKDHVDYQVVKVADIIRSVLRFKSCYG